MWSPSCIKAQPRKFRKLPDGLARIKKNEGDFVQTKFVLHKPHTLTRTLRHLSESDIYYSLGCAVSSLRKLLEILEMMV